MRRDDSAIMCALALLLIVKEGCLPLRAQDLSPARVCVVGTDGAGKTSVGCLLDSARGDGPEAIRYNHRNAHWLAQFKASGSHRQWTAHWIQRGVRTANGLFTQGIIDTAEAFLVVLDCTIAHHRPQFSASGRSIGCTAYVEEEQAIRARAELASVDLVSNGRPILVLCNKVDVGYERDISGFDDEWDASGWDHPLELRKVMVESLDLCGTATEGALLEGARYFVRAASRPGPCQLPQELRQLIFTITASLSSKEVAQGAAPTVPACIDTPYTHDVISASPIHSLQV